jgi:hypothetical protein
MIKYDAISNSVQVYIVDIKSKSNNHLMLNVDQRNYQCPRFYSNSQQFEATHANGLIIFLALSESI